MASPEIGLIQILATPAIVHTKVSAIADGSNTSKVRPVDWNANHTAPAFALATLMGVGPLVWTNQPSGLTELLGVTHLRAIHNLAAVSQMALTATVSVAGAATAVLRLQYTLDLTGATGWTYLDGATGPSASLAATGCNTSGYVAIETAAKASVLLRVVGIVV